MEKPTPAAVSSRADDHRPDSLEGGKISDAKAHLEHDDSAKEDLVYDDEEHEPQLRLRTWAALAAMWLFNYVNTLTLLSPPVVVRYLRLTLMGRR